MCFSSADRDCRHLSSGACAGSSAQSTSFFCALSLLALASSLLLYEDLIAPTHSGSLERTTQYYGKETTAGALAEPGSPSADAQTAAAGGGPAIALPDDAPAPKLIVAMPYRKLLEVTHFHLFTVPVFLLILTHLFMLTALSARAKQGWITLGWSAATLHMLAPWLIRAGGTRLTWLFPLSGGLLFVGCLVLTVYPVWVMWKTPPKSARPARSEADGAA